jgi:hypothetical protein
MESGFRRTAMQDRLPSRVELSDDVVFETIQDEVVLLKLNGEQYYGLDEVGANAWKFLLENGDIAAAGQRLCEKYAGDPATIRSDLYALVAELIEAGVLKAVDV